jgi:hypothetical protein
MPPKRGKQKKKGKGKKVKGKPKTKGFNVKGSKGGVVERLIAPAVNYSGVYDTSQYLRFGQGSSPGALKLSYRLRVCDVKLVYAAVTGAPTISILRGVNNCLGTYFLCPANAFYTPAPLLTFALLFNRWTLLDGCAEYVPRVLGGTGSSYYITWGTIHDPEYPDTHGWTTTGTSWQPTEGQISTLDNSRQFPAWIPQQCIKFRRSEKLYSVSSEYNTAVGTASEPAEVRQQYAGILAMAGNENANGTPSTEVVLGQLFLSGTYEFEEMSVSISQDPTLTARRETGHSRMTRLEDAMRKLEVACGLETKERDRIRSRSRSPESSLKTLVKNKGGYA